MQKNIINDTYKHSHCSRWAYRHSTTLPSPRRALFCWSVSVKWYWLRRLHLKWRTHSNVSTWLRLHKHQTQP